MREPEPARPIVEWIVAAISGALVAALISFLLWQALFHDARPPELSVAIEAVEKTAGGVTVTIGVANDGDRAAAAVSVRAETAQGGRRIEFDYLAGHAVRRGAFVFSGMERAPDDLVLAIDGYVEP